jgi:DNA-binding beta-propeller fold protein YncE
MAGKNELKFRMSPYCELFCLLVVVLGPLAAHAQDGTGVPPPPFLYVTGSNGIQGIDASSNTVFASTQAMGYGYLDVAPDGSKIYAANVVGTIDIYDPMLVQLGSISVGSPPRFVKFARNGKFAVVTTQGGMVLRIDTASDTVTNTLMLGGDLFGIGIMPTSDRAFVANVSQGRIYDIDVTTWTVRNPISAPPPLTMALTRTGDRGFVIGPELGSAFDTSTDMVNGIFPIANAFDISNQQEGMYFFVTTPNSGTVHVFNNTTLQEAVSPIDACATPPGLDPRVPAASCMPFGEALLPDGSALYVAETVGATGQVAVIDTTSLSVTNDIPTQGPANFIGIHQWWYCGTYVDIASGATSVICGPPTNPRWANGCPSVTTLDDGSTWQFQGGCKCNG